MYLLIKRILDILLSLVAIAIGTPIFLLIVIWILITMGPPFLFCQERTGKDNRPFRIYKFRTMNSNPGHYLTDEQRITRTGKLLRIFRIDELPQLLNILMGDMSFIGPRPLLPGYLPFYKKEELKRHNVRPGLSGLSQVNHLRYPDWETQLNDDIAYVEMISFKTDLNIFFKTIRRMFKPNSMLQTNSKPRPNLIEYRSGTTVKMG